MQPHPTFLRRGELSKGNGSWPMKTFGPPGHRDLGARRAFSPHGDFDQFGTAF